MPIANDLLYGGTILNDGSGIEETWAEEFQGCYENEEATAAGNPHFLMLWLHAYRYAFNAIAIETKVP